MRYKLWYKLDGREILDSEQPDWVAVYERSRAIMTEHPEVSSVLPLPDGIGTGVIFISINRSDVFPPEYLI